MSFQNPAGLWLLLLIPLLIIIYIIRSRYENRAVSSTYIWQLSDRFLKKRLPLQRLTRMLLFLLQLLLIALFALAAAKPTVKDGIGRDFIVILDCSAEMQVRDSKGVSRFERAVEQVEDLSKDLTGGHTLTVILAGHKASYLIKNTDSAAKTATALDGVDCQFGSCNMEDALELALKAAEEVSSPKVLLYTHQSYDTAEGITVTDLSRGEWNLAFSSLQAVKDKQVIRFTTELCSYNKDAEITVGLKIENKTVDARALSLKKNEKTTVVFEWEGTTFDRAMVFAQAEDGMAEDNFFALCPNNDLCRVLLASPTPFYLKNALESLGNCKVNTVLSLEQAPLQGYDLYIFDGLFPEEFPTDGGVLLFGTEKLPDGLTCSSPVSKEGRLSVDKDLANALFSGVSPFGCYVKGHTPLLGTAEWVFPLYCGGNPVFAVRNDQRSPLFAVCSFDLHHSNLPLQADFIILMKNLVTETLPSLLRIRDYAAEESLTLSVPLLTEQLYLETPDGALRTLSFSEGISTLTVSAPGVYTAAALQGEKGVYADFFVHVPIKADAQEGDRVISLALPEKEEGLQRTKESGVWFWVALTILILMLIEWGVYYREQY